VSEWQPIEHTRYPMRHRKPLVALEDVDIRYEPLQIGQVVAKMILSEQVILDHRKIAARALEVAVDEMGKAAAYAHQGEIQRAVDDVLRDTAWIRPIIEQEIRRTVSAVVAEMLRPDPPTP
jgi:hypothetical protein